MQVGHCSWNEKYRACCAPPSCAQLVSRTNSPASFTCPVWHRRSVPTLESSKATTVPELVTSVSLMVANWGLIGLKLSSLKVRMITRPVSHWLKDTCRIQWSHFTWSVCRAEDRVAVGRRAHPRIAQLRVRVGNGPLCSQIAVDRAGRESRAARSDVGCGGAREARWHVCCAVPHHNKCSIGA